MKANAASDSNAGRMRVEHRAFSSKVDAGLRRENATKQKALAAESRAGKAAVQPRPDTPLNGDDLFPL
jgi:hypothetical protein